MPNIFEEITIFAKNLENRMYIPRDVTYISIEKGFFLVDLNVMAISYWRQKKKKRCCPNINAK